MATITPLTMPTVSLHRLIVAWSVAPFRHFHVTVCEFWRYTVTMLYMPDAILKHRWVMRAVRNMETHPGLRAIAPSNPNKDTKARMVYMIEKKYRAT